MTLDAIRREARCPEGMEALHVEAAGYKKGSIAAALEAATREDVEATGIDMMDGVGGRSDAEGTVI